MDKLRQMNFKSPIAISEAQLKMFLGRTQKNPEIAMALMEKYNIENPIDFKKRDFNNILIEIDNCKK
jgi:hypothetical protein